MKKKKNNSLKDKTKNKGEEESYYQKLRELPYNNDRVGQSFIITRFSSGLKANLPSSEWDDARIKKHNDQLLQDAKKELETSKTKEEILQTNWEVLSSGEKTLHYLFSRYPDMSLEEAKESLNEMY